MFILGAHALILLGMTAVRPLTKELLPELTFLTSRSGGPGGQNVNKVNSKVTLKWDVLHSARLSEDQRQLIVRKLATRLTQDGILMITAQESRSQLDNRAAVLMKLENLLVKAFAVHKVRKATKPGKAAKQARINAKKHRSEKKQWRQKL